MQPSYKQRSAVLALAAGLTGLALTGCGSACEDAIDLCEECDGAPDRCQKLFESEDNDTCEAAVEVYEASCKE